MVKFDIYLIRK